MEKEITKFRDMTRRQQVAVAVLSVALVATSSNSIVISATAVAVATASIVFGKLWKIEEGGAK